MDRLDIYEKKPAGMEKYLSTYGWHFSKAMCQWAVSMMTDRKGNKMQMPEKNNIEERIKTSGFNVEAEGYDIVYVYAMAKADFFGSSIANDAQLIMYVSDYLNDTDGYDEVAFTRFYADCVAKGKPIIWSDML